ncbi:hypothetical protein [Vibrio phage VP4B]|uniref:Uncharacterized protein n=1 Tax=Vibrio phage VP4B TaxID=1262540 RepID=V9M029_9CAUD|nr:hypothetical protein FDJ61_gp191 [Vibrio phage VP4B]AGB07305.1 hypothetical protein [Vibrio phage VP4B]
MKTSLVESIRGLVGKRNPEVLEGDFDVDLDTIQQNVDYPDRFTAEGFLNGVRIPLAWKRVSFTNALDSVSEGTISRDDADQEGVYYDGKIMHHYLAVKPNHGLDDVNRLLGTNFTDEQLLYRPERMEARWVLNHPCYYGRIFIQVLLPKAS